MNSDGRSVEVHNDKESQLEGNAEDLEAAGRFRY